jgi:hypothetical protein
MSILSVAIQNMLAHENRLNGDTTPVKPHIRAWQKQISDRIAFNRFMLGLEIPLTHSAIPTLGTAVPSFTRATTETGQKWDDNGYLDFTALAGEIVFKGARRERNLLTFPEDFSNAAWTKTNTTEAVSSVVIPTAARTSRITNTTANGIHGVTQGPTVVGGGTYQFSVKAVAGTIPRIMLREASETGAASTFDLTTGTVVANESGGTGYISPLVGGGYLCTLKMVATTSGIKSFYIYNMKAGTAGNAQATYVGTTAEYVDISAASLNDITGETDQTTIRPYVSVGVESAPAYHGSMVDGVKCFDTDRLGNPIATTGSYPIVGYVPWEARTNLVWPSEDLTSVRYVSGGGGVAVVADQVVAPDGTTTADQLTAAGANGTLIQDLGVIASTAQCFSLHLKRKTGTGNIDITLDGGATWTTQTINSTTWTRCEKTQTLANPDVGIRIVTSGDAVYAWGLQCE